MKPAESTLNEKQRQEVLDSLATVYSPAEKRFDDITRMARQVFDVPVALVSLVSKDKQWFKSTQGLAAAETPRKVSFCGHAIHQSDVFIVEDASQHDWFADNPLVTNDPYVRFYAGHPLDIKGQRVGTLCLLDSKPRKFTEGQINKLKILAESVEEQLALAVLSPGQQALLRSLGESQREQLVDPATQMWNRQGIERVMLEEFRIAGAENRALVLVTLEIEGFDALQKQAGEQAVSSARIALARRLRDAVASSDALGLYNEKTFMVLFAYESDENRADRARALLAAINETSVDAVQQERVLYARAAAMTAYSPANLSVVNLLSQTDKALTQVRAEPAGSILFFDRRQSPRD